MKKILVLFLLLFSFNVGASELDKNYLVITGNKTSFDSTSLIGDNIEKIIFYNDGRVLSGTSYDVSMNKDNSIILYKDGSTLSIVSNENIFFPEDSSYLFAKLKDTSIDFNNSVDVSRVKNMDYMFDSYCYNLSDCSLELNGFNNVTSMKYTFQNMAYNSSNVSISFNNFDTKNVTNMAGLFKSFGYKASNCVINNIDKFNTSGVVDMNNMFNYACLNTLSFDIDLSKWDLSKVKNTSGMFSYMANKKASSFTMGDLSNWNTLSVTNMSGMFDHTASKSNTFDIGNISNWNTSNVEDMSGMFSSIGGLNGSILNLSNWDTSKVDNFNNMFYGSSYLSELYIDNFTINGSTNLMFDELYRLEIIGLGDNYFIVKTLLSNPNSTYLSGATGKWYNENKEEFDISNIDEKGYYYAYKPYKITYKDNNSNIIGYQIKPYNKSVILDLNIPDKIEFVTTSFDEDIDDIISKKITKYTPFNFNKYSNGYKYDINEDLEIITSVDVKEVGEKINLPFISKDGYKFIGWSKDNILFSDYIPLENSLLKANWEVIIPETGDGIMKYMLVGIVFAIGLLVLIIYVKKSDK